MAYLPGSAHFDGYSSEHLADEHTVFTAMVVISNPSDSNGDDGARVEIVSVIAAKVQ